MPITLALAPINDPVARDLTRFRLAQRKSLCTLTEAVDASSTSIKLSSLQNIVAGIQLFTNSGELMTVTSLPEDRTTGTVTVHRGDTSVLLETGARAHLIGETVSVLKYKDVSELVQDLVRADIQKILVSLGPNSETFSGVFGGP